MPAAHKALIFLALILLTFFPRLLDRDAFRSPDEDRWIANTSGFTVKLAHGQLAELLQQPHPGIPTQWLGALTIRYEDWAIKKVPLVIGQSLLILLTGYIFGRLWGTGAGVAAVVALAANPVLYAHTRIYAMDSLLALFSCLALGCLLLWRQEKVLPWAARYVVASAFFTAAAILSKLPGIALLPVIAGVFVYDYWRQRNLQATALWLLAFLISLALILPSFAIVPQNIIGDFLEFFRSDDYQELHHLGPYYYLGTLAFFSTPLHWIALIALAWLVVHKKISALHREQIVILLLFGLVLVVQMTWGAKKGDRYILPAFVMFDVASALVVSLIFSFGGWRAGGPPRAGATAPPRGGAGRDRTRPLLFILIATVAWQFVIIWQTHPHTLAYVNPLTRPWFGDRRHGWGEGLDIAAGYLNQKPHAAELKVATYYPVEFDPYFAGEAVPVHQHEEASVDYVIVYRAMFERGESWESDVLKIYQNKKAEKIIELSGVPMAWIYATDAQ